jgi:hypothetical protein
VDEVCAHGVTPHQAETPLTPLRQVLVEPVVGGWDEQQQQQQQQQRQQETGAE